MKQRLLHAIAILSASFFCASIPAQAEVVITARETGGDVVFTVSGSLQPGASSGDDSFIEESFLDPSAGDFEIWPMAANANIFPLDAAVSFGPGDFQDNVGTDSGTSFAIFSDELYLEETYTPGDPINGTLTFSTATFASLGVTARATAYIWRITDSGDTVRMIFPAEIAKEKAKLRKQIRNLKKRIRAAKRNGQNAKAKRLGKKVKKLQRRLRMLG